MPRDLLIRGARLVLPDGTETQGDILVRNGHIELVGSVPASACGEAQTLDARGLVAIPGIIDLHAHLCEPGHEERETLESGLQAAIAGGVTSVVAMPDTTPPADNRAAIESLMAQAQKLHLASLLPAACLTRERKGSILAEMAELADCGAVAFTNDPDPVYDSQVMKHAMEYGSMTGRVIIDHPEDRTLSRGGLINEGRASSMLGLSGIPAAAEEIGVARNVLLAEALNLPVHICHISSRRSVRILRDAKKRGVPVTAETSPAYFCLTEETLETYDPRFKLNPPLRTEEDRREIVRALKDGTIDAISSDHTPRADWEKEIEFDTAAFGAPGLETLLPLCVTALVRKGHLDWPLLVQRLCAGPARILRLTDRGALAPGLRADITLVDDQTLYSVQAARFVSRSRLSPFEGMEVAGHPAVVVAGGHLFTFTREKAPG